MRPERAGEPHAGLHLVEDEQELALVGQPAQLAQELGAEVVVAPLALDRLDDAGRDVVTELLHRLLDLRHRVLLGLMVASRFSPSRGNRAVGWLMRGHSNFGKYIVFRGSAELVSDSV